MVELQRRSIGAQIGAGCEGNGVAVRVLDLPAQYYVPCDQAPNTMIGHDPYTLWLAPGRALQVGGAPPPGFVSDMTDGLAVFELSGPRALDVIAMSTTLTPPEPGACAQTLFGGVRVLIYPYGAAFRIHVERQLAAFILAWFQQAASAQP